MLRPISITDILFPLTLIFWVVVLWALIKGARALGQIGAALQRIAHEMERRRWVAWQEGIA